MSLLERKLIMSAAQRYLKFFQIIGFRKKIARAISECVPAILPFRATRNYNYLGSGIDVENCAERKKSLLHTLRSGRQAKVQRNQRRPLLSEHLQGSLSIFCLTDFEFFGQRPAHLRAQRIIVFDNEQLGLSRRLCTDGIEAARRTG